MMFNDIGSPVTGEEMRGLKAQKDEKKRLQVIKRIITNFYKEAIKFAELNYETKFIYTPTGDVPSFPHVPRGDEFLKQNKKDIITNLEKLFPGCVISYQTINDLNKEEKKCFPMENILRIVVDWS